MADTTVLPTSAVQTMPLAKFTANMIDGNDLTAGTLSVSGNPDVAGVIATGLPAGPVLVERGAVLCRLKMSISGPETGIESVQIYFRAKTADLWTLLSTQAVDLAGDYSILEDVTDLLDGEDFSDVAIEARYSRGGAQPPTEH